MNGEDFFYVVRTRRPFQDAILTVLQVVEKKGWALLQVYDLQERLQAKGFQIEKIKIIEICSAKHASLLLAKDKRVSLCMPCKINVYEEEGTIKIATMKPTVMGLIFSDMPNENLELLEKELKEMVDSAV